jgi:hypothetical protein
MRPDQLFGATLDTMSEINFDDAKAQLADLLVKATIAAVRGKGQMEQEQPVALAVTYLAFDPDAEPVSGQEAEDAYYDAYQEVWKHEMDTSEDSECWNGEFDWTRAGFFPLELLKRIARACAALEAAETKAWYKWCEDNPEIVAGTANVGSS